MAEDLIKSPVNELAIKLLHSRVHVLPVKVAPSDNLDVQLFCHCLGLGGIRDHGVDLPCGALAELEE